MKKFLVAVGLCVCVAGSSRSFLAAASDVVLYSTDVTSTVGAWSRVATTDAAGGEAMRSADNGVAVTDAPLSNPANYFEAGFTASANTTYHVWLRLRATGDSKWNDSVWVQFGDAVDGSNAPLYRSGTTSGLLINLETCSGCGVSGWGWADGAWWLAQTHTVRFPTTGAHTIRVQIREDGAQVDQIVLSPSTYLSSAPGAAAGDTTIVPKPSSSSSSGSGLSPFTGTPAAIPGTIASANYDNGGEGVAYHDTTAGNSGGAFRPDSVDIEASGDGGYDIGWTAAGEWLNYTVSVAAAGTYNAQIRVASPAGGGSLHLGFASPSSVWSAIAIPQTGDWQAWTTVTVPVTLAAGTQVMTLWCDTNGFNIGAVTVASTGTSGGSGGGSASPAPYTGTASAIPGAIQAENFDNGGEGVAYHDTTTGNTGGQYRSTGVDIQTASSGGYNIGWMDAGEWLAYTVNVATAGSYSAQFRVAAAGNGGTFHLEVGGKNVTGPLTIPNTGDWQSWTTVTSTVTLSAGTQLARVVVDAAADVVGNFDSMTFAAGTAPPPQVSGGGATISVPAGGDLQGALNRAQQGDTILLAAGATYLGGFVLPAKSGSGTITIRSAASDSVLPPGGTRITPSYSANLPKVRGTAGAAAFSTEPGAHDYRLLFLELTSTFYGSDLLELGDGSGNQSSLSSMPQNFTVDRCYLHGDPSVGQKRGIALNSGAATITNSYISGIFSTGVETQAIAGWNGPGPYVISNNYLEAASENILFGGNDPAIPNLIPSDITISRNRITKPTSWQGAGYGVKNLVELKNAQRVTIDGNIIENNWLEAQSGYAILLTPRNQDHTAPWSAVQHITISNNVVQHIGAGITMLGTDDQAVSQPLTDVSVANNLFLDVSGANWGGSGWTLLTLGGSNIRLDHNTIFADGGSVVFADVAPVTGFSFTNNILPPATWSIIGTNNTPGTGSIATYFPGSTFARDVITGAASGSYPSNNYFPATTSAVGFVDVSGGNYRLASTSPYKGKATDGSDVGTNIDALNASAGTAY